MEKLSSTTIYIIRHGQTQANVTRMIQGQLIDEPLNAAGLSQVEAVGRRLSDIELDRIYSSPLRRARQTAAAIRSFMPDVPYIELADLMEMGWGVLEGQSFIGDNESYFARLEKEWSAGHFDESVEKGESINDVLKRAVRAFDFVIADSIGESVAVVTHGRLIRVLLSTYLSGYSMTRMDDLLHTNTAVSKLTIQGKEVTAEYLRDTSHILLTQEGR